MFFICDKNDVIQDISTRKENLVRGYDFEAHKIYNKPDMHGATVLDKFKDGLFLIDIDNQTDRETKAEQQILIASKIRSTAIAALKAEGKLPPDFEDI
jgi:hypothetical protein